MGRARSYRELRVYREAFALAMEVFELTLHFPDHEKYDLARQARRSSRSVCANTAEAWRRRHYPAALVAKLIDAQAEAAETRVHIEFAHACGYLPTKAAADLDARYDRLLARLTTMRTHPEKWVPRKRSPAEARTKAEAMTKVDSHRRPSTVRIPTPHPRAPEKKVESRRSQSAAATPAQAGPTKPAARPEPTPTSTPPSTAGDRPAPSPP